MAEFGVGLVFALFCLLLVLVICWIVLPFAVIGTKPLLQELIEQQRATNAHLADLKAMRTSTQGPEPKRPAGEMDLGRTPTGEATIDDALAERLAALRKPRPQ